ncbi:MULTISPECIES: peptide deformylase [Candidatus Ichthyocystis]|uniref:Peptide deformylase-like n=1 Tax=Candidatus Ichthyocystis hellenicum TaxID=1561003 RepID=A0A0S4M873_9BURK|nr:MULTISPECIES: peptide deformylase [Ichthyocystis]CUT17588.1 Peptide deformylase [Candidatus Ichthyocystis hellenicum]
MIKKILLMGDPLLVRKAEKVTSFGTAELLELIVDLRDTQHKHKTLGLSAPQIGINQQVMVIGTPESEADPNSMDYVPKITIMNPSIELLTRSNCEFVERCLCIPHMKANVPRFTQIRYFGIDEYGSPVQREAFGRHAQIVQHHADHIFRTLYTMRIRDFTKFEFEAEFREQF